MSIFENRYFKLALSILLIIFSILFIIFLFVYPKAFNYYTDNLDTCNTLQLSKREIIRSLQRKLGIQSEFVFQGIQNVSDSKNSIKLKDKILNSLRLEIKVCTDSLQYYDFSDLVEQTQMLDEKIQKYMQRQAELLRKYRNDIEEISDLQEEYRKLEKKHKNPEKNKTPLKKLDKLENQSSIVIKAGSIIPKTYDKDNRLTRINKKIAMIEFEIGFEKPCPSRRKLLFSLKDEYVPLKEKDGLDKPKRVANDYTFITHEELIDEGRNSFNCKIYLERINKKSDSIFYEIYDEITSEKVYSGIYSLGSSK